ERLGPFAAVGLDATPQGRPVYSRLGFSDAYDLARWAADPAKALSVGERATRPMTEADLDAVLAWDRDIFGADRARVLRWAFVPAPERARVATNGGALDGYCFGRRGHHSDSIGPTVARSPAAARALIASVLARARGRRTIADAVAAPGWEADLEAL